MPPSTMAWALARAGKPSAGMNTATLVAPRSRARRADVAVARRRISASPLFFGPRPTTITRAAGMRPPV